MSPTQAVIRQPMPPMTIRNGSPPIHDAAATPAEQGGQHGRDGGQPDPLEDGRGSRVVVARSLSARRSLGIRSPDGLAVT